MRALIIRFCLTLLAGLIIASISQWFMDNRLNDLNKISIQMDSSYTFIK